jgi:hypothetical protein
MEILCKGYAEPTEPRKGALGGVCIKARKNLSYKGMSGMVGDQLVAKRWMKSYVVGSVPQYPERREYTEKQLAHQLRFRRAASYAQSIVDDEEYFPLYERETQGRMTPYNAALRDYMTPPDVHEIDISEYTGAPGEEIRIVASDDVLLESVKVVIVADGEIVERGEAVQHHRDALLWIYTTQEVNEHESYTVRATVRDLPGNRAVGEVEA